MTTKRGRPKEVAKAQNQADLVFLHLAAQRSIDKLRGQKPKGRQRISRSFTKQMLPNAARVLSKPPDDEVSPRSLERHYYEHGKGALVRIAIKLTERKKKRSEEALAKKRAKAQQELKKIFRNK